MKKENTTRRNFLKQTGALCTAPYIITSSALGDGIKPPASDRLAMGYIGVGGRGRVELREFMKCPLVEHVACADPIKKNLEMANNLIKGKSFNDFRELLALDDINAVSIATPDHWHVPIAVASARAKKSAFVAKPLGLSIEQNLICRDVFKEEKVMFGYGTQQRSSANCHKGCEIVRRGLIGEVTRIEVVAPNGGKGGSTTEIPVPKGLDYEMWLGPAPKVPYTANRCKPPGDYWIYDYAIGYLAGWGAHPLDIMVWGSDADQSGLITVEGSGDIPTEELYDCVINWDMKLKLGKVEMTFKPGRDVTRFIGTNGWIAASRGGLEASSPHLLDIEIKPEECELTVSKHHQTNFAESVLEGKTPISPIGDAVRSDTISHLCDIAVRLGRKVTWDPEKERFINDPDATKLMHRPMRQPWSLARKP